MTAAKSIYYRLIAILVFPLALTGCFYSNSAHYLNYYGDSDDGGYSIGLDTSTYLMMIASDENPIPQLLRDLSKFSNPEISTRGDYTYIEDRSGASMEYFYDSYKCTNASAPRLVDCRYRISTDRFDFPGWSFDHKVYLKSNMRVVSSNAHRERTEGGKKVLIWNFNANRHSSIQINFTVRTPRAS